MYEDWSLLAFLWLYLYPATNSNVWLLKFLWLPLIWLPDSDRYVTDMQWRFMCSVCLGNKAQKNKYLEKLEKLINDLQKLKYCWLDFTKDKGV